MKFVPLPEDRPALMGILNVTPDSFSDGGVWSGERAVARGMDMLAQGADLVDVGGESTRPGAEPVAAPTEIDRVLPVVKGLVANGVVVSVDTSKAEVAEACLKAGASVVNDVTAWRDPDMRHVCAHRGATVCLMHMQGEPRTMQAAPTYGDVVAEVKAFLFSRAESAVEAGLEPSQVWIDPGIGFGKTLDHNLDLLANLGELAKSPWTVLVGVSRKSFIGKLTEDAPPGERIEGTLAAQTLAQALGARVLRVHDVLAAKRASTVASAVLHRAPRNSP
ncbi:MAG: dihydropteroate synthase [Fimbriimonadaceae bacterium]|nr:dihydropteroate synthase [Fimbriimonadaceae bacterium]QYK57265.1 MAG: dihydropteroate synthase [Fimbriimonadaceae bacterium]